MTANKSNKNTAQRVSKSKAKVIIIPVGTKLKVPKGTLVLRKFNNRQKRVSTD